VAKQTTRRDFLRSSTLAGVGFWVGGASTGVNAKGPNDKIGFAAIGVGGKGSGDCDQAASLGNLVAICDIDDNHLNAKAAKFPEAKKYNDYRKMLEEMGSKIDAVTVSTADHTHACASVMAMKMKKHVYCQKPLTHSVYEARRMREIASEMKVCTQMGNQGTAENGLRRAVEIIQAGVLGPIREIHVWTNRPVWDQAPTIMARPKEMDVPKHVHWDLFLGPAQERPYNRVYHPFSWRGWWDFGTGALGDMACHTGNMAFMACKLGYPTSAWAEAGDLNPETCPTWARVVLEFPSRGDMPPLKWFWYEGREGGRHNKDGKRILPPDEILSRVLKPGQKLSDSGSLLVGDKGILFSPNDYGASYQYIGADSKELEEAARKVPERLPRNGKGDQGMKNEWVEAIRQNNPKIAMSNFDYAGMLTEAVLLGNVAMRCGKKLDWNGPELKATNCPDAAQYIKREYRSGFEV
jgi:predicted dehydrogenase